MKELFIYKCNKNGSFSFLERISLENITIRPTGQGWLDVINQVDPSKSKRYKEAEILMSFEEILN